MDLLLLLLNLFLNAQGFLVVFVFVFLSNIYLATPYEGLTATIISSFRSTTVNQLFYKQCSKPDFNSFSKSLKLNYSNLSPYIFLHCHNTRLLNSSNFQLLSMSEIFICNSVTCSQPMAACLVCEIIQNVLNQHLSICQK